MELQQITINGRKVVALACVLESLSKAHAELVTRGIGYGQFKGFVLSDETTGGWRSLALQKQLVARGASKTLYSNHRRGSAVDCAADWAYIKLIRPTMNKYGLFNDLAYIKGNQTDDDRFTGSVPWDGGHWNYKSNAEASKFDIIDVAPAIIKEFTTEKLYEKILMLTQPGVPGSGGFAVVIDGKKHVVSQKRLAALVALIVKKEGVGVSLATWDSIPSGENF